MKRWTAGSLGLALLLAAGAGPRAAHAARDIPSIAFDIMRKDLEPAEWNRYARKAAAYYEDWMNDNPSGNLKRFLDDKLLPKAMGARSGKIKNLKRFIYWLSLYKAWREPAPSYIRNVAEKNRQDLDDILKDFSWERASKLVRKKSKEYEDQEKGEKERRKRAREARKRREKERRKRAEKKKKEAEKKASKQREEARRRSG